MGLLEELAVRCEAATRCDAEAETMIYAEINGWPTEWRDNALVRLTDYYPIGTVDPGERNRWFTGHVGAPAYTASIEAAMTLIPSGLRLAVSEWDDEKHLRPRGPWQAILTKAGSGSSFNEMLGYRCDHAATPALAICAASLRARHALALSKGSRT